MTTHGIDSRLESLRRRQLADLQAEYNRLAGEFTPAEVEAMKDGIALQALGLDTPKRVTPAMSEAFEKYNALGLSDLAERMNSLIPEQPGRQAGWLLLVREHAQKRGLCEVNREDN